MRTGAVAALAALAAVLVTAPAHASCKTRAQIDQPDGGAPLAVGDSVMLAAARQLAAHGFAVDAQACRRFDQGLAVMSDRELPDLVVVALGSNASVSPGEIERALDLAGPRGRLVFVLPRELGGGPDPDGRVMRAAERAYPDRVSTLNWPGHSERRSGWFASDGLHLTSAGAQAFADFVAQATAFEPLEAAPPAPNRPRPRRAQEPEAPPQAPPAASGNPFVAELWRSLGRVLTSALKPGLHLIEQVTGGGLASGPREL